MGFFWFKLGSIRASPCSLSVCISEGVGDFSHFYPFRVRILAHLVIEGNWGLSGLRFQWF
jgi:hypothetical protein